MTRKILKLFLFLLLAFSIAAVFYVFIGKAPEAEKITWGVDFSQKHSQNLGLDWQEVYSAYLDDLKIRQIRISTSWDLLEKEKGEYDFSDLDWQIEEAKKRGAKIILAIGMKTPRWPECHLPYWASDLTDDELQQSVLNFLEKTILRYQENPSIWAWQIENEPFLAFGQCPKSDKEFLEKEIVLTKKLDPLKRPIVISDSGEWSLWLKAAGVGDIVGVTLYRRVWIEQLEIYSDYYFPPAYYRFKAGLVKKLFNKKVICVELQAEPWGPKLLYDTSLEEQRKSMTLSRFSNIIGFAKKTGFDTFYLWGGEWWYWLKEKKNDSSFWDKAKEIFTDSSINQ